MFAGVVVSSMPDPSATEHPLRRAAIAPLDPTVHPPNSSPRWASPSLWVCIDQLMLGCAAVTSDPRTYSFISRFPSMLVEGRL